MSLSSAIRSSDRKASHLLGVTLTRDPAQTPKKRTFLRSLGKRLRRSHRRSRPYYEEDGVVWDVPNPFAPPDPELAHLHALIQEEIARERRFESIGPHDRVHGVDDDEDGFDSDDGDDEDSDDEDDDFDADDDADADDEDEGDIEDLHDEDKPASIALPRLLPIPLRFIPSPSPSPSPPPPTPIPSSDEDYNNTAEAEARAARKAKRDAHRSRSKALAILGPEARSSL
ncbi:hypothetical protein OG21DRAFT_1499570 [Imleria badia]|nr:hypothetical protein OG21DRAFT_1499570 [Imleria badia]